MTPELPPALLSAARFGRLNILVGAGLSIDAGLPNWATLLRFLTQEIAPRERRQLTNLIDHDRFLDAAQLLYDFLPKNMLHQSLVRHCGQHIEPSPLHDAVWALHPPVVFTTNYDCLLETAYSRRYGHAPTVVLGTDKAALGTIRSHGRICKLHGDLSTPESIILSRQQYYDIIESVATFPGALWSQFTENPCLALGYSLRDPDIQLLLHWMEVSLRGYAQPFYLLTNEERQEELQLLRTVGAVVPLQYRPIRGNRASLIALLRVLANERTDVEYLATATAAELALLRSTHTAMKALIHGHNNAIAPAKARLSMYIETHPDDSATHLLKPVYDSLTTTWNLLRQLDRLLTSGSQRMSSTTWEECRNALSSDLADNPGYASIKLQNQCATLKSTLPIGPSLYSTLVRIMLDNSLEAIKGLVEGTVILSIRRTRITGRDMLVTAVKDSGPGIDPSVRSNLFLPGATTKGTGRGQGLFLLRSISEECGGSAVVTSTPGNGTVARLVLPVSDEVTAASSITRSKNTRNMAFSSRKTVFLLEDHSSTAGAMTEILTDINCQVVAYQDARSAIKRIRRLRHQPAVLVCDIVMPGDLSGFDVVEHARERFPEIPVVFISGYTDHRGTLHVPNSVFLMKPFSAHELKDALDTVLDDDKG